MSKNTQVKKVAATKPANVESVSTPVPEPVAAPVQVAAVAAAPVAEKKKRATKPKVVEAAVAPVVVAPVVVAPVVAPVEEVSVVADEEKRQRPKLRAFDDIYAELSASVTEAYNMLQTGKRSLKSLQSAHNREVHNNLKTRESASRTPTIVFDQALVDYFRKRLPVSLLKVSRKGEEFDLSGLNTDTRVHRTDVTQLYTAVFKHHNMQNPADRRNVVYSQDADLVSLLTTGDLEASLLEDVKKIKDGSYKLTIFNIQRFTNQHLGKVEVPVSEESVELVAETN